MVSEANLAYFNKTIVGIFVGLYFRIKLNFIPEK